MPTARPVAVALAPQHRVLPRGGRVDFAEYLLQERGEERVLLIGSHDDQVAALPENVIRLVDHVDLQLALAPRRRDVQGGLEFAGQVPQIRSGYNACFQLILRQRSA